MYKLITFYCTLLMGITTCFAQSATKSTAAANKSLLWKISGKGLKKPSYLFGTIHMICTADYVWTPAMDKALQSSERVAFEMDMDDPQLQTQMATGLMLKDGKKLKDLYSEADYQKLSAFAAKNGLPLEMMQQYSPFALVSFLYMKALTCPMPASYEGNITGLAQAQKKEILGLETVEEQVAVIEKMNMDSLAGMVLNITNDMDSFKNTFNQILAVYKKQDLPELYKLFLESPDYKDDLNALLFDRNRKWVPAIEKLVGQQSTFVAVGAGHLWGGEGVISLLRQAGYTVEPVK
ncbi:MAG: TraB/GumN family protein [Sphingobacteriales bacterium]|nr:MAG: TraB/GumN family protein [Sphingobacteriales bacterium]